MIRGLLVLLLIIFGLITIPVRADDDAKKDLERVLELQKEIEAAAKANDPQKMIELIAKLQRLMQVQVPQLQLQAFRDFPGRAPVSPVKSDLRQQYEKQLKDFEQSIEKLKDEPDARAAIEKARDEYKKAMEADLKKADDAVPKRPQRELQPQPLPGFPRLDLQPIPFPAFDRDLFGRRAAVQPRLGVQLEVPPAVLVEQLDMKPDMGLVVADVLRAMPAEKAGLKKNDIILQLAGKDVASDVEAFQSAVAGFKAGEKFDIVVLRKGKKVTIVGIEFPEPRRPNNVNFSQVQMQINNGVADIQAMLNGVKYRIVGDMEGLNFDLKTITIGDGDDLKKYESVNKVPQLYRPAVDKLISRLNRE